MSRRSKRGGHWRKREAEDPYVKRARAEGWRSRAAFKLQELDRRGRLIRPGMTIVDLGAAPGGWSQYAARRVGASGRVIALDLLEIEPIPGVELIQADFSEDEGLVALREALGGAAVDLVMSDMAPNITGLRAVDQPRAMLLAELARDLAFETLAPQGGLVIKLFQGEGFDDFVREIRSAFARVAVRKPAASRDSSRETYLVAGNYKL